MSTPSGGRDPAAQTLPSVFAEIGYLGPVEPPVVVRIYPPASGLATVRPASERHRVSIADMRQVASEFSLDVHGFACGWSPTGFADYYDEAAVRRAYFPEVSEVVRVCTGALEVIVFDHNVRSGVRAARGEPGVRVPVDQVHNDYTERSGPKRKAEILAAAGRPDLADRRFAFVNLWRPIVGPVQDNPLTLCDARSVAPGEFVATEINHYGETDLERPRHTGEIYSVAYHPRHRWYYLSDMRTDEFLLLKCYDSQRDGRARFMPHTGFVNPACPSEFVPRESIEARTLVVFDEPL